MCQQCTYLYLYAKKAREIESHWLKMDFAIKWICRKILYPNPDERDTLQYFIVVILSRVSLVMAS